jgi:hypothetical protein
VAVDRDQLRNDLRRFYDFTGRVTLYVGAGGGQLLDASFGAKKIIAIDQDRASLERLYEAAVGNAGIEIIQSSFEEIKRPADVVYFEFCLHEMRDPSGMLAHARTLAPETVVFEHAVDSDWTYYAGEEDAVGRAAEALQGFTILRRQTVSLEQRFRDYDELFEKVRSQGDPAIERIRQFAGAKDIVIPIKCQLLQL